MYWNKDIECMSRDELHALQLQRLQKMVKHIYTNVPFYRRKLDEIGAKPEDIKELKDLAKLPFTYKTDLRDNYPNGLVAVPQEQINRIHASSGTTGKPTVVAYTKGDVQLWSEMLARGFTAIGASSKDIIQVSYGYGLFTGGLGLHYGAEMIGASVLPTASGNTHRQILLMQDLKTTILCCTPSYALYIAEILAEMGIDPQTTPLKTGVFGAEPWTESMRKRLEKSLGIKAYDIFGLSELCGPGVSMECEAQDSAHIWEDNFIVEIINPETGEVLPEGSVGEMVFTTITKEGMPLLRYRTRDLSSINLAKCACGRTHARMTRIAGRSDDMLIIRGVNVFPSQVESALLEMGQTSPHYHLVVDRKNNHDTLEIQIEIDDTMFSDYVRGFEALKKSVSSQIEHVLGLAVDITFVEPKTLARSEGKAKRVTDKRDLNK